MQLRVPLWEAVHKWFLLEVNGISITEALVYEALQNACFFLKPEEAASGTPSNS